MPKKFYFICTIIILIFSLFIARTIYIAYFKHDYYLNKYILLSENYVYGASSPRGRILDINGQVLVDNIGINTILYHKKSNIGVEEEIEIAKRLVELTNYKYSYDENVLKDYFLVLYPKIGNSLISDYELELYKKRKLSKSSLLERKKERITDELLNKLTEEEKYSSYFYYLMNKGYYYDNKVLIKDVDDDAYAKILEANLPGVFGELFWERTFPFGDTLKTVLGTISSTLPEEKKYLLNDGYTLTDRVGISGLEEYYEEYLKGEKALYKLENDNLVLVNNAKKGNDLILEIDINMVLEIENIIKKEMLKNRSLPNTEYYKESFALVSEPKTGAIKAMVGLRMITNNKTVSFQDISINMIKNAYTVGSVVKGASMTVGYQNKAIDIGTTMTDSCVKLANIPAKCSWTKLGRINDIQALALSSNYYQFVTALKVAGYKYKYNMEAPVTINDFNKYRDTFAKFGLGTITGIDLPNETTGLKGEKIAPDLLMNLAIGQYDLYTPTSLLQYINTIASDGNRYKLNILNSVKNKDKIIFENKKTLLNKIDLEDKYLKRIQAGFKEVMKSGTGYWYANPKINAAGKTGTSESYIDTDYNGTLDAYVISNTFIMYAPFDNPKYSIVVISPNTANLNGKSSYQSGINRLIARGINDYLFSN